MDRGLDSQKEIPKVLFFIYSEVQFITRHGHLGWLFVDMEITMEKKVVTMGGGTGREDAKTNHYNTNKNKSRW